MTGRLGLQPGSEQWLKAMRVYYQDDPDVMALVVLYEQTKEELEYGTETKLEDRDGDQIVTEYRYPDGYEG